MVGQRSRAQHRRDRRAGDGEETQRHGTPTAYGAGKCRCRHCKDAVAAYRATRRAAGKDQPRKARAVDTDGHIGRDWFRRNVWTKAVWATHSRLQPVIDAAKTLKRHDAGLLSYFAHRITNAAAESLNSRIQAIRVSARGYRNRNNFKTAIYFHCGGLQLYSQTHAIPG